MNNWKKTFAVIWTGQFLSLLTSYTANFALILWITMETGSAEMLAYGAIAAILPQAVIGPLAGVYIDRWKRKQVMILADSFIGLCTLALAVLFWFDAADMWAIFAILALRSIGSGFHMPAMQASVPLIAPESQLTRVAGINQMISSACNIAGPALGALFITLFEMEYVLMLDVVGAVVACTSLAMVTIPNPEKKNEEAPHVFREMKEGVMTVLRNRGLSIVFLFSIIFHFFLMPISVMFPLMTTIHFAGGAYQVSLIEVIWGVGALAGGAIMGARVYKINKIWLMNAMYVLCGITFLVPGLVPASGFVWFAVLTGVGGVTSAVYSSSFIAIVQTNVEPAALGRVFSMFNTMSLIPSLVGLVGIGFFADYLGVATSFVVCGAVIILVGVAAYFFPSTFLIDKPRKS